MKMEAEIISRENIKPSSPTPLHKRTHKLSLLDQIFLHCYVPLVLYYPNLDHQKNTAPKNLSRDELIISHTTQILKQSLSATLSLFYPLAGRFIDTLSIDCNDEGALFVVAKFNESLSDFLKRPDPESCRAHIPGQVKVAEPDPGSHVAMIQVNYFECGGIAIASFISHKVADGATNAAFMKAWGAAATAAAGGGGSGGEALRMLVPSYATGTLFPQKEFLPDEAKFSFRLRRLYKMGRTVMRRYVFDAAAISKLREELPPPLPEGLGRRPSRVETVTAFIWKCYMVASDKFGGGRGDGNYNYLTHAVNLRRKADPPFPETTIGNFIWRAAVSTVNNQTNRDMKHLFSKMRSAISNVDADFVKRMQGEEGLSGHCKNLEETLSHIPENADGLYVTSWCNFGFHGIDFGWGKPTWITKCDMGNNITDLPFVDSLWLTDTTDGVGIEAWLIMDERYYAEFDKIKEITGLASVDPSPLDINGPK